MPSRAIIGEVLCKTGIEHREQYALPSERARQIDKSDGKQDGDKLTHLLSDVNNRGASESQSEF